MNSLIRNKEKKLIQKEILTEINNQIMKIIMTSS